MVRRISLHNEHPPGCFEDITLPLDGIRQTHRFLLLPAELSAIATICSKLRALPPAPRSLPFFLLSFISSLMFFDTFFPNGICVLSVYGLPSQLLFLANIIIEAIRILGHPLIAAILHAGQVIVHSKLLEIIWQLFSHPIGIPPKDSVVGHAQQVSIVTLEHMTTFVIRRLV